MFKVGDLVMVDGDLHQGIGKVVATAYPLGGELIYDLDPDYPGLDYAVDYMNFKLDEPFPQVRVAILDDIKKPGRIIRYHGEDLAIGKVTAITDQSDFDIDFDLDTACRDWWAVRKAQRQ